MGPPAVFLSALEGIHLVRKCFMNFDVNDNTMAYLRGNENEVYTVQQKQRSRNFLEWICGRSELDSIFNVMQGQFSVFNFREAETSLNRYVEEVN
jgi:hypothetical protein